MSHMSQATVDAANRFAHTLRKHGATATIITDRSSVTIGPGTSADAEPITDFPDERADVPHDDAFDETDFLESIHLSRIGNALIRKCPEFTFLNRDDMVTIVWKRQGGQSKGKDRYGQCQKASGLVKFFGECEFVIWIAADHVRESLFTNLQLEALVYSQLKHCGYEIDDKNGDMKLTVRGHDDELFYDELRRYGAWRRQLKKTAEVYAQLGLAAEGGA